MLTQERPRPDLDAHRAVIEAHRRDTYYDADAEFELNKEIDEILAGFDSPEEKMISLMTLGKLNTSLNNGNAALTYKVIDDRLFNFAHQAHQDHDGFSENPLMRSRTPLFTEKTLCALASSPLMDQMLTDPQLCPVDLSDPTGRDLVGVAVVADAVRSVGKDCQVPASVDTAVISVADRIQSRNLTQIGNARHMLNVISTVTDKRRHDPANTPLSLGKLIPAVEPKAFVDAEVNLQGYLDGLQKKNSYLSRNHGDRDTGADNKVSGPDF